MQIDNKQSSAKYHCEKMTERRSPMLSGSRLRGGRGDIDIGGFAQQYQLSPSHLQREGEMMHERRLAYGEGSLPLRFAAG